MCGMARGDGGDADLLRQYLDEIGRHPLLTREEEQRLGRAVAVGREAVRRRQPGAPPDATVISECEEATRTLIQSNLRLVVAIAKRYQSVAGLGLLDLIQEGNLGLMRAVERFDYRRGFRFSTYATWWIRQSITRAIANTGRTIRLPVRAGEMVANVQRAQTRLEATLGRTPTVVEIVEETGLPRDRVVEALTLAPGTLSISEPLGPDGSGQLGDVIADPLATAPFDEVAAACLPAQVTQLLAALDSRERHVVCLRYGLDRGCPRTLQEVADECGLTREGVRHIEKKALVKLRLRTRSSRFELADLVAG